MVFQYPVIYELGVSHGYAGLAKRDTGLILTHEDLSPGTIDVSNTFHASSLVKHLVRRVEYPVTEEDGSKGFGLLLDSLLRHAEVKLRVIVVVYNVDDQAWRTAGERVERANAQFIMDF